MVAAICHVAIDPPAMDVIFADSGQQGFKDEAGINVQGFPYQGREVRGRQPEKKQRVILNYYEDRGH